MEQTFLPMSGKTLLFLQSGTHRIYALHFSSHLLISMRAVCVGVGGRHIMALWGVRLLKVPMVCHFQLSTSPLRYASDSADTFRSVYFQPYLCCCTLTSKCLAYVSPFLFFIFFLKKRLKEN